MPPMIDFRLVHLELLAIDVKKYNEIKEIFTSSLLIDRIYFVFLIFFHLIYLLNFNFIYIFSFPFEKYIFKSLFLNFLYFHSLIHCIKLYHRCLILLDNCSNNYKYTKRDVRSNACNYVRPCDSSNPS